LSKKFSGLQAIILCFLPPYLTDEAKAEIIPKKIGELLTIRWFPAMNHICNYAGMGKKEINNLTDRTIQYIVNGIIRI